MKTWVQLSRPGWSHRWCDIYRSTARTGEEAKDKTYLVAVKRVINVHRAEPSLLAGFLGDNVIFPVQWHIYLF